MCWCRQRNCSVYFPPKLSIPCIFTTFQIYSQMYCIFVINYYILLLNTHIFTSHCILYVAMCSGMACMWLLLLSISALCVQNEHWAALRTDECEEKVLNESSLRPLANPQEQMFMVFISLHVCLHDIFLYMCMCQSTVLHPLLELIPQLARRRSRRMKLNVCILHAYLHSDFISAVSMTPWEPLK